MTIIPDYKVGVKGPSVESTMEINAIPSSGSGSLYTGYWGKDFPFTREELEKLKQQVLTSKRPRKTREEFFEQLILRHAQFDTPSKVSDHATDEEKAAERRRRLQAPTTRHRFVFSTWPRDPNGRRIEPENSKLGKMAANGIQHWGATLFDFYHVRRIPDFGGLQTTSTGSKLAAWMKANEEDYAKDELELAEEEEDPREILPCDIAQLIEDSEMRERKGITKGFCRSEWEGKGKENLECPRPDPFDTLFDFLPILQQRLPLHLLPATLIVHDPFRLLKVSYRYNSFDAETLPQSWSSKPDIVHVYRHTMSTAGRERMEKEKIKLKTNRELEEALRKKAQPEEHSSALPPYGFYIPAIDADLVPGPTQPWVYAMHEPPPLPNAPTEAHLYLSPSQLAGKGNHSYAYHAEWDLPRDLLVPDVLCKQCVIEEAQKVIAAEDAGAPNPKWTAKRGEIVLKEDVRPEFVTSVNEEPDVYVLKERSEIKTLIYEGPVRIVRTSVGYQSLTRGGYCAHLLQHDKFHHPSRTTVRVTAKLSFQGDRHLGQESQNYQAFPAHFFEHWNGYNVVPPLHDPVPVGALVPQYYGYYVPDEGVPVRKVKKVDEGQLKTGDEQEEVHELQVNEADEVNKPEVVETGNEMDIDESRGQPQKKEASMVSDTEPKEEPFGYRSAILLMENCGSPIKIDTLNIDDRHECASLIYRFHHAGWVHHSVAERNILCQPGPLSEFPTLRTTSHLMTSSPRDRVFSFRLIDFGRSGKFENSLVRAKEESSVGTTFDILGLGIHQTK